MYCLDTDIIIEYLKDNQAVVRKVDLLKDKIKITPINVLELFYGAYRSSKVDERVMEVHDLLNIFNVLKFTMAVYDNFGKIKSSLKEKGKIIDNFDFLTGSDTRCSATI